MKKLRIGYFADGPWSHEALKRLLLDDTLQVLFVCARNDSPDPVLKDKARENGLDFITHPKVNSNDFLAWLSKYDCDLFVSMSFNQIFRSALIN